MKFTSQNVSGTVNETSKVPVETSTEKGYLTIDELAEETVTSARIADATWPLTAATPNNTDVIPVAESASTLKKITFANLWTWVQNKITTLSSITLNGAWSFAVRPTCSASAAIPTTGTPPLITSADALSIIAAHFASIQYYAGLTSGAAASGTGTNNVSRPGVIIRTASTSTNGINLTVGSYAFVALSASNNNSTVIGNGLSAAMDFIAIYSHGGYAGMGGPLIAGPNAWGWVEFGQGTGDSPVTATQTHIAGNAASGAVGIEITSKNRAIGGVDDANSCYARGYTWDGANVVYTNNGAWTALPVRTLRRCADSLVIRYRASDRKLSFTHNSSGVVTDIGTLTLPAIPNDRFGPAMIAGVTSTDTASRAIINFAGAHFIIPATNQLPLF